EMRPRVPAMPADNFHERHLAFASLRQCVPVPAGAMRSEYRCGQKAGSYRLLSNTAKAVGTQNILNFVDNQVMRRSGQCSFCKAFERRGQVLAEQSQWQIDVV